MRVYNYAHVSPGILTTAERVAREIFASAGVETAWVECPRSWAEFEKYPACHQGPGTTDFAVRLLSASMAAKIPSGNDWLGFAQFCPEDERGCVVNMFYSRVMERASQIVDETALNGIDGRAARILGHAMAHEMGHLLLGRNAHSARGIMRAVWSPDDLKLMTWACVAFIPTQSGELQSSVKRRTTLEVQPEVEAVTLISNQAAPEDELGPPKETFRPYPHRTTRADQYAFWESSSSRRSRPFFASLRLAF